MAIDLEKNAPAFAAQRRSGVGYGNRRRTGLWALTLLQCPLPAAGLTQPGVLYVQMKNRLIDLPRHPNETSGN